MPEYSPVWMDGPNGEKKQALTQETYDILLGRGWKDGEAPKEAR